MGTNYLLTVKLRYNVFLGTEKIVRYIRGTL